MEEGDYMVGLMGQISAGVTSSTPASISIVIDLKPSTPTGLHFNPLIKDTQLQLIWNRVKDSDIKEYRVFRNGNLVPIKILSQTAVGVDPQFIDMALSNAMTYKYRVIAVDVAGNKSDMSVEVQETTVGGPGWAR